MKVFLDANVLVSVLNKEYPLFGHSSRVLSLAGERRFQLYTSATCIAIAFYFASKKAGKVKAKHKISVLADHIKLAENRLDDLKSVAANKKILDIEDGLEYLAAKHAACRCIITEDTGDFHFSSIEVLSCDAFLKKYVLAGADKGS